MGNDLKTALNNKNLSLYLKNRTHHCYKFYSTCDRIETVAKERCLYLSDGRTWNDVDDRKLFNPEDSSVINFGICFSFSRSENIAMWMLYGGMNKSGALINFTKSMFDLQSSDKPPIKLGTFKNDQFQEYLELSSSDYTVNFWDALYYGKKKKNDNKYSIKHSDDVCNNVALKQFYDSVFLKKNYAWSYENETRLVISFSKSLLNNLDIDTVRFPLKRTLKSKELMSRIVLAPNYSGAKTYAQSALSKNLDWDLCKNCSKKQSNDKTGKLNQ